MLKLRNRECPLNHILSYHQYHQPRNPLFIPSQAQAYSQYQTGYTAEPTTVFYQPQQQRGAIITAAQPPIPEPERRKRNVIAIKDPKDGHDETEELCQRPQSADSQPSEEQQAFQQVQKQFVKKM